MVDHVETPPAPLTALTVVVECSFAGGKEFARFDVWVIQLIKPITVHCRQPIHPCEPLIQEESSGI